MDEIIKHIEVMRLKLRLSKRKLSALADISEEYYWRIVTGVAPGCSYTILQALCIATGLQIKVFIDPVLLDKFEVIKH